MSYKVIPTPHFKTQAKKLSSHYHSFKDDLKNFVKGLEENPMVGIDLGGGIRKVRLKVDSKGKGKSGGLRVIEFIAFCDKEVYLVTVYDKSRVENIPVKELKKIVKQIK